MIDERRTLFMNLNFFGSVVSLEVEIQILAEIPFSPCESSCENGPERTQENQFRARKRYTEVSL